MSLHYQCLSSKSVRLLSYYLFVDLKLLKIKHVHFNEKGLIIYLQIIDPKTF